MKLDRVTITGPDDSIRPEDLIPVTKEFPFVEWGILYSASSMGSRRFPKAEWLWDLRAVARREHLPLSLHLCGRYVRQILLGQTPQDVWTFIDVFDRVQLNFHAERNECNPRACAEALKAFSDHGQREFIFQLDGERGNQHLERIGEFCDGEFRAFGLFDISGGAGILPDQWPAPRYMLDDTTPDYHGYAGGLGPDNLAEQIPLIGAAAGDCRIWIDMETKVRSEDDRQFDLAKVRRCLELAKPFVTTGS